MKRRILKETRGVCAAVACCLAVAAPLSGQAGLDFAQGPTWLVGYVANAPNQLLGAGTLLVHPALRGWGLYADGKISTGSPAGDPFLLALTPIEAENLGDLRFRERSAWTSANLAAVRPLSRELALYLGGGISERTVYGQYLDRAGERGQFGHYWVEDVGRSRVQPNVIGGAFFRLGSRLAVQFGVETAPPGFSAGGHLLVR